MLPSERERAILPASAVVHTRGNGTEEKREKRPARDFIIQCVCVEKEEGNAMRDGDRPLRCAACIIIIIYMGAVGDRGIRRR